MKEVDLGNLEVPILVPKKGVDYFTEADKTAMVNETTANAINSLAPTVQNLNENEQVRIANENERKANEQTRIQNEENREDYVIDLKQRVDNDEFKGDPGVSPTVETSKSGKVTTITITDITGPHVATINDGLDGEGSGNMHTTTYDVNNNGIVDNAEKVNNHTVEKDVPSNAVFTDTVYDDTALSGRITTVESAIPTKVDKETGKSLISDTEITRLANVDNYDDTALSGRVTTLENDMDLKGSFSIATTDWTADTTWGDYTVKATITVTGVTANDIADIYFDNPENAGEIGATGVNTVANGIEIYAESTPESALTGKYKVAKVVSA